MLKIKQQIKNVRTNILYEVYGVNPRSKTYHIKIIGLPNQKEEYEYLHYTYKIGQKFNIPFKTFEVMGYYELVPKKQKTKTLEISMSHSADSFVNQLKYQSFDFIQAQINEYQKHKEQIINLYVFDYITENSFEEAMTKLYSKIKNHVKKHNNLYEVSVNYSTVAPLTVQK